MAPLTITFNDEVGFLTSGQRNWQNWIEQLLLQAKEKIGKQNSLEMSINFVDQARIHAINKQYRGKDRATDVISFAIEDGDEGLDLSSFEADPDFIEDIGDLFICPDVVRLHAKEYETGFDREFGYTCVHGFLHLNGYDHIKPAEAKVMFGLQGEILSEYGLPLHRN
ncbi:MAG: rRNA maturation RNase YbeY [Lactobacillus sp.]|jgi:probable rRNA maturation factor|nr:rRNA maturation RNase YbeY [Lactobacillus sp.]